MTSTTFPGSPSLLSRSPLACISIITLAGIIHVQGSRKATDEGTSEIIGGMKRRNAWFNTLLTVFRGGELCTRYPLDRSLAIDQFSSRLKFLVWVYIKRLLVNQIDRSRRYKIVRVNEISIKARQIWLFDRWFFIATREGWNFLFFEFSGLIVSSFYLKFEKLLLFILKTVLKNGRN